MTQRDPDWRCPFCGGEVGSDNDGASAYCERCREHAKLERMCQWCGKEIADHTAPSPFQPQAICDSCFIAALDEVATGAVHEQDRRMP